MVTYAAHTAHPGKVIPTIILPRFLSRGLSLTQSPISTTL